MHLHWGLQIPNLLAPPFLNYETILAFPPPKYIKCPCLSKEILNNLNKGQIRNAYDYHGTASTSIKTLSLIYNTLHNLLTYILN